MSSRLIKLISTRGLGRLRMVRMAGLNPTYGYQTFVGARRPSRNKMLQLAFAMVFAPCERSHAIGAASVSDLCCKRCRDAIIIFCPGRSCFCRR